MTSTNTTADRQPAAIGIDFPPVKDQQEIMEERQSQQRAAAPEDAIRKEAAHDIPPVVRSALELAHMMMSGHSQTLRATPGYEGGTFYDGTPYCFASGFRDGTRPLDMDDKGNHLKLKDPLNYGNLTLPITAAFLCDLHSKGTFSLMEPLTTYIPELPPQYSTMTARKILSFEHVIDDNAVLREVGISRVRPRVAWNMCNAAQVYVFNPINTFFCGKSHGVVLSGSEQRSNFVQYLRSSHRVKGPVTRSLRRARISHFSVALLVAAVESQLGGKSFEDAMRTSFFERAQCHGSGFGAPKLWRDPNDLFYQPTGQSLQHQGFKKPVPVGANSNCAPALLNGSLNLYAPVEDFGKLSLLSIDTIRLARDVLGKPEVNYPHYDFGIQYIPQKKTYQLKKEIFPLLDALPSSAAIRYSSEYDLGCFGITNTGTRNSRLFSNILCSMIQHLFIRYVLAEGVDAKKQLDLDNPTESMEATDEKFKKVVKKQEFSNYVKTGAVHTRF